MSLEALAERTWKTQRVLMMPIVVLGAMVLIGGLVSGFPLFSGVGLALAFGGGVGIWRMRVKAAEFKDLLANPQRVTNVIPVVQTVQASRRTTRSSSSLMMERRIASPRGRRAFPMRSLRFCSAFRTRAGSRVTPCSRPTMGSLRASR